jgi:hypothetical protein
LFFTNLSAFSAEESENIVLIRDAEKALKFVKNNSFQLEVIHLDYHLNHDYFTGQSIFEYLLCLMDDDKCPKLKTIYLHSSDKEKNQEIIDTYKEIYEGYDISVINNFCEQ